MKTKSLLLSLMLFASINSHAQWQQAGSDIDGNAENDEFGSVVDISAEGDRMVVGAHLNDGNGRDAGQVQVYEWDGNSWVQLGRDIQGSTDRFNNGDYLGYSVAISGNGQYIALGVPQSDYSGLNAGHAFVLEWKDGSWVEHGDSVFGQASDFCGASVSLSDDGMRLSVGSEYAANGGNLNEAKGQVRVYEWSNGNWTELGNGIEGETAQDQSYRAVLSGDGSTLAMSSPFNDAGGNNSGHVRVYREQSGAWQQLGSDIDGSSDNENSGYSISLNEAGNILAVGVPSNSDNGYNAGAVRIYEWKSSSWQMKGNVLKGKDVSDLFGNSVSLSGNGELLAVGASYAGYAGEVSIHRHDGSSWIQMGDTISGEGESDISGSSISLASHGARIAIGAPHNAGGGSYSGQVRVFDYQYGVGIEDALEDRPAVFPNPSTGKVFIQSLPTLETKIQVLSLSGELIQESKIQSNNGHHSLDLQLLNPNIYIIKIINSSGTYHQKLILSQ